MKTTALTPRFEVGQQVIAQKRWSFGKVEYQPMRISKIDIFLDSVYCYLVGETFPVCQDDVFASEEELTAKTGKKLYQTV